ncbi:sulfurtransferase [Lampropedia puyangensis]|uniref:Sulfurtransferase n=1 Tax=Lampropedia puyangensis TaxID=1330072 RepID=A0A4V4GQQ7_9BURK|nr:sulfurtransferase [Lampropedia puyangensis]THT98435.1 sulfurtransferase [Lampropedia puyangensis]
MTTPAVLNIASYLFTQIDDRENLQPLLRERAEAAGLRGSILLAPEGINMFLAGAPQPLRDFLDALRADDRFAALEAKESWSHIQPFRRLIVKLKNEIIRMNHPTIRPVAGRAPAVDAPTLRRWLDQGHDDAGKPVVMLDTRNAFEADYGSFDNAIDWRISKFTEFPDAVQAHKSELEGKTVVSFCTGGIRCEKAAILMHDMGLTNVLQLDGGILKYFEQEGGAHYSGECFVFDGREALAPDLSARSNERSARACDDGQLVQKKHRLQA